MINYGRNENFREWIYFTDNYGIVRIYILIARAKVAVKNAAFFQKRNTYWIVCYSSLLLSLRGYGRGICYVLSCPTAQYPL